MSHLVSEEMAEFFRTDPKFQPADKETIQAFIQHKIDNPPVFVKGRRKFRDEPLPEEDPEDEPCSPMDELNLAFVDAICDDDYERMERFYALGADIHHRNPGADETPLHFAVSRPETKFAKWLIEHGADVNARAVQGNTPLHWAARIGHVEMIKLLLEKGADPHPQTDRGITPYWYQNKEQSDCKIPEETRKEIQSLLKNPPITQIIHGKGPIVFGADPPEKVLTSVEKKEKAKAKKTNNPAERMKN